MRVECNPDRLAIAITLERGAHSDTETLFTRMEGARKTLGLKPETPVALEFYAANPAAGAGKLAHLERAIIAREVHRQWGQSPPKGQDFGAWDRARDAAVRNALSQAEGA